MNTIPQHILDVHPHAFEPAPEERTNAYVYALVDPATECIRYIGTTINPLIRREAHKSKAGGLVQSPKERWVSELRKQGMRPRLIIIETVDLAEGKKAEKVWIDYYEKQGAELLNRTIGRKKKLG